MLYFVIGLPGAFTNWCGAVVAGIAGRAVGASRVVEANTLGDIARTILRSDTPHLVISARALGGRARAALLAADRPFVIAGDDARLACADLVVGNQCTLPAAVRQVASSCGAMMGFGATPGALTLHADRDWSDNAATATALANHFHFAVGDRDIAAVLDEIERADLASRRDAAQRWWNQLAAAERESLRGALDPYLRDPADPHAGAINWSAELFSLGDRSAEPAIAPIDITGRPRCLLHGPNILLPSGSWSLSLTLGFTREAADHEFFVEIFTDRQLASSNLRPHHEGDLAAELSFVIDDSSDYPVTIRLSTRRAAFDGLVTLRGASLLRHPEAGASDAAG